MRRRADKTHVFQREEELPRLSNVTDDPLRYFGPFLYAATTIRNKGTHEDDPSALPARLARLLRTTRERARSALGPQVADDCTYLAAVLLDSAAFSRRDALSRTWTELRLEHALCGTSSYGQHLGNRIEQLVDQRDPRVLRFLVAALGAGLDLALAADQRDRVSTLARQAYRSSSRHVGPSLHPGDPHRESDRLPRISPWAISAIVVGILLVAGAIAVSIHASQLLTSVEAHMPEVAG
jgi:type VI protein secretion system component VasF